MGLVVSLLLIAAGLILALAVHPASSGSVDVNTVGWIIFIVGLVGFILDLLLWSDWGPGYMRRGPAPGAAAGYPARRVRGTRRTVVEEQDVAPAPRRTVVEEEDVAGPPPPGY